MKLLSELDESSLAARVRAGDADAFAVLYDRYVNVAWAVALTVTHAANDAEEAVAQAFIRFDTALRTGTLEPHRPLRPYLLAAVRRAATEILRSAGSVRPTEDVAKFKPGQAGDSSVEAFRARLEGNLAAGVFATLPKRARTVLWLADVEGLDVGETAEILGMPPGETSELATHARVRFRKDYLAQHPHLPLTNECLTSEELESLMTGRLPSGQAAYLEQHASRCTDCSFRLKELQQIGSTLRRAALPLTGAARQAIRRRWEETRTLSSDPDDPDARRPEPVPPPAAAGPAKPGARALSGRTESMSGPVPSPNLAEDLTSPAVPPATPPIEGESGAEDSTPFEPVPEFEPEVPEEVIRSGRVDPSSRPPGDGPGVVSTPEGRKSEFEPSSALPGPDDPTQSPVVSPEVEAQQHSLGSPEFNVGARRRFGGPPLKLLIATVSAGIAGVLLLLPPLSRNLEDRQDKPPPPSTSVPGRPALVVTPAEAKKVTADFEAAMIRAYGGLDIALADSVQAGPMGEITKALFQSQKALGRTSVEMGGQFSAARAKVYVPRQVQFPAQFLAVAPGTGKESSLSALALFRKESAGATWKLTVSALLPNDALPSIALDRDGLASLITLSDAGGFKAALERLPAQFATFAGTYASPAAPAPFAPGRNTTAALQVLRDSAARSAERGVSETHLFSPGSFPVSAYRLTGGGVLAFFTVERTSKLEPLGGAPLSTDVGKSRGYLPKGRYRSIDYRFTLMRAAVVPSPDAAGTVDIIAAHEGITSATGRPN